MKLILKNAGRVLLTLAMLVCAGVLGRHLWQFYMEAPWTRDGRVCADIVHITPDVSGLIQDVMVKDNQFVHKGDVLFRIDLKRFTLALEEARAEVTRTKAALAMAKKDFDRYDALVSKQAVSLQTMQEAESELKQDQSSYDNAVAAMKLAELNLERATVKATVNGKITNFSVRPGNYAQSGEAIAALVDSESFYVAGYFEETKLHNIHPDDPVRIDLMGESEPLFGHVASISSGIQDQDNDNSGLLESVTPTFSWVRLAQRIPVRIAIDKNPKNIKLIVGRTATVSIMEDKRIDVS